MGVAVQGGARGGRVHDGRVKTDGVRGSSHCRCVDGLVAGREMYVGRREVFGMNFELLVQKAKGSLISSQVGALRLVVTLGSCE